MASNEVHTFQVLPSLIDVIPKYLDYEVDNTPTHYKENLLHKGRISQGTTTLELIYFAFYAQQIQLTAAEFSDDAISRIGSVNFGSWVHCTVF